MKKTKFLHMSNISNRLATLIDNQSEFARALGISHSRVNNYVHGKVQPNAELLQLLAEKKGININWLLTGEGPIYVPKPMATGQNVTPILTRCPAGRPQSWEVEREYLDEHIPYIYDLIPHSEEMFGLRVTGDSMCPSVRAGDVVIVDMTRQWRDGDMVVARFGGEGQTLKYVEKEEGGIRLVPENPAYETQHVPSHRVEWIGVVVGIYREDPRNKNGAGSVALVKAMQVPQVGDLAVLLAVMPEEFLEAMRTALRTAEPQPERQNIHRFAFWMQRILLRAQDEIGKLLEI